MLQEEGSHTTFHTFQVSTPRIWAVNNRGHFSTVGFSPCFLKCTVQKEAFSKKPVCILLRIHFWWSLLLKDSSNQWYISGIYCQLGDYMLPTTYWGNQETPLIKVLGKIPHHFCCSARLRDLCRMNHHLLSHSLNYGRNLAGDDFADFSLKSSQSWFLKYNQVYIKTWWFSEPSNWFFLSHAAEASKFGVLNFHFSKQNLLRVAPNILQDNFVLRNHVPFKKGVRSAKNVLDGERMHVNSDLWTKKDSSSLGDFGSGW